MTYRITVLPSAVRELARLDKKEQARITRKINALASNPRPPGVKKLSGPERYRIRSGDYRVVYEVRDTEMIILVVRIGHRREVYRR